MRHPREIFIWTTGLVVGLVAPTVAAADATSPKDAVTVLALRSDGTDDQADALSGALRASLRSNPRFSLAEGDYSLEVLSLALHCGDTPDPACLARIGKEVHSDRYVWGVLHRVRGEKKVHADLHYWERGQPSHSAVATYPDNLTVATDAALRVVADGLLKTVLSGQVEAQAGAASGAPVPVAAPAHAASARDIAAASAQPTDPADTDESHNADDSARRAVGWAGLGLGAVMLGASAFSAYRVYAVGSDDAFERYRRGFGGGADVCQEASLGHASMVAGALSPSDAHDSCSQASTYQTLEFVFLGLGVVSAGAGIYLLATSHSERQASTGIAWELRPHVGRTAAVLDLSITGF